VVAINWWLEQDFAWLVRHGKEIVELRRADGTANKNLDRGGR